MKWLKQWFKAKPKVLVEHTPVQTENEVFWEGGHFAIGQSVLDSKGRRGKVTNKLGSGSKTTHYEVLFAGREIKLIPASKLKKVPL